MLSTPQTISTLVLRRASRGHRRLSPTPSEQSYQTIGTHPASLFSASRADVASDSLSLTTVNTGDFVGGGLWDRFHHPEHPTLPNGCAFVRAQPPSFLNLPTQRQQPTREKDLFEFLKEAELEHYYAALTTHLKIRSVEQIKYVEDSDLTDLGFSRPEQRRLRKYFKRECPQTTMGKLRKRLSRSSGGPRSSSVYRVGDTNHVENFGSSGDINGRFESASLSSVAPRTRLTSGSRAVSRRGKMDGSRDESPFRFISPEQLELGTVLGRSEFCQVHQGVWRQDTGGTVQVAVKAVEARHVAGETYAFLNRITVLHKLSHPDIIRLYGVSMDPDTIRIVSEAAPLRSLLECLRDPGLHFSFPVTILHRFATQIARAMAYLEELGIVHRDLAARNVLVFGKDIVKVGDVSASRVLRSASSCYHSKFDLPIAWYAPECIHDSQFTSASDAWAYGVTLWEMFTYGFTPWVGLSGHQIMEAVDSPQCARLDQPDACPDAIYDAVMRTCWSHEPEARPTFNQLLGVLPRLYPEPWISTREYKPSMDEHNTDGGYRDSHAPNDQYEDTTASHLLNRLPLGKQLSVRSKEVVYVLAKRNAHFWRVVTHETHRIGCLPTSILTPYTRGESCSRGVPATPSASVESPAVSKTLSRNPRRETVCRLARLGSSVVNGSSNEPRLTSEEISLPRSDFRHVGHVGRDGTTFGNLGFESREKDDRLSPNEQDSLGNAHPEIEASSAGTTLGSTTLPAVCDNSSTSFATHKRVIPASTMSGCKPDSDMRSSVLSVDTNSNGFEGGAEMEISMMNLNFGTSLLDEVFKCFSLNPVDSSDKEARNVECSCPTEQCVDTRRSEPTSQLQPNISCKMNEPPSTSSDASESSACTPALAMNSLTTGPLTNLNHRFRSKMPSFSPSCSDLSVTFRQPDPDTMRKSRPMTRECPLDASELHTSPSLRTRWRRSTFNSLTRRSASVSKLSTTPNLFSTLGRKCSEPPDDLNQNKRLTISRPILISKPVCVGKTPDFTISNHLMTSSSSSTAGHITDPSPFTRGNSLTTNTSPMNYGLPNLTSSSVDCVLSNSSGPPNPRSDNVEHSTHHLLSSASIPSSIHPLTRASDLVTADFTESVGTTGRRLRTLRAGDVVFRAGTNTSAGNVALNSLRKPTGPSLSGHANGTRPIISRPRDLSHSSNAIRSPDYLSNDKGSTNLLSRLDGLCVSNTSRLTTDGDDTTTRDVGAKPNMTRRLGRCLSVSSSSSSASIGLINRSPGLSPLHTVGPGFISCTTPRSDSTSRKSGLTNQMASFWGSTFADLINSPSTICSDAELNGDVPLKHGSFLAPHN